MKVFAGLAALALAAGAAWAVGTELKAQSANQMPHPGQAVYRLRCAACHDNPGDTKSPSRETLGKMSYQVISFALTQGKMQAQAAGLTEDERGQLINYLTGRSEAAKETWSQAMACPGGKAAPAKAQPAVATFGFDARQTRVLTAKQTGLSKAKLGKLDVAWGVAFPDVTMMRAQPAVVGNMVYLPVAEASALYAFDVSDPAKPCVRWVYNTPGGAPLRTGAAYGVIADGTPVLAFSGLDTTVHVLDARTGRPLWHRTVGTYSYSLTTGTPRVLKDRIIVPVSQFEIMQAYDNKVACCTNHGYVLSLDPKTGAQQWRYDTMPDAQPVRDRGDGKPLLGPSGAPIWNSPLIDEKRGLIYFGTGESNSPPAHRNTNALIAIRLKDGTEAWSHQATPDDIFNVGCGPNPKPEMLNCVKAHETVYRDVDFGASLVLAKLKNGKELVLAGQKSGTLWALEPETGKVVWRRDIGAGTPQGGIHWGIAYQDDMVLVPIAHIGRPLPGQPPFDPKLQPGMYGVDANTGEIKWHQPVAPSCEGERAKKAPRCERVFGFSGAPTVIDGAVIQGSLDGRLFVLDAKTGERLWTYDALRDFDTLNGVPGRGGSFDSASIVGVNGLVLVGSGYGMFGQAPGNMLLAFKPKD
jgi:polyvinyl alcohol dehydrogenase (cytochrome)